MSFTVVLIISMLCPGDSGPPFILSKAQCSVYCLALNGLIRGTREDQKWGYKGVFWKATTAPKKISHLSLQIFIPTFGKNLMMQLQHFKAFIVHKLWFCVMASLISFYLYDSICVCMFVCMHIIFFVYLLNLQILDALSCCCSSSNKNVNFSYSTLVLK